MIDPPGLSGDELSCTEASCCIKIVSRSDVKRFLLEDTLDDASPSLMQMLLCHCGPPARKDSGTFFKWAHQPADSFTPLKRASREHRPRSASTERPWHHAHRVGLDELDLRRSRRWNRGFISSKVSRFHTPSPLVAW